MKPIAVSVFIQYWPQGITEGRVTNFEREVPILFFEFYNLYLSWKKSGAEETTDLVVFCDEKSLPFLPDDVIPVVIQPISEKNSLFKDYPRMNSLLCYAEKESEVLEAYQYVGKIDCDSFFTPVWNNLVHDIRSNVLVGSWVIFDQDSGVYENLERVAKNLHLRYRNQKGIGTTIIGPPDKVLTVLRKAAEIAKHLLENEFQESDGEWGRWYKWVSVMWALQLSVNHYDFNFLTSNIDCFSVSHDNIVDQNIYAITCASTKDVTYPYNKQYAYRCGYDHVNRDTLNPDIVNEYCLSIFLEQLTVKDTLWRFNRKFLGEISKDRMEKLKILRRLVSSDTSKVDREIFEIKDPNFDHA